MNGDVDLSGSWTTFWNAVTGATGTQLTNFLSVLGVIILVFSLAAYFWQRSRNKGSDSGKLWWAVVVGSVFAAPGVIFPLLLGIVDLVANAGIGVYQATAR